MLFSLSSFFKIKGLACIFTVLLMLSFYEDCRGSDLLKYGTPFIKHFTKKQYKAGNKNWSITQDERGFIYVGNSNGLLQYDGIRWKRFNLPGATIVRSVFADNCRIYTGSLGEFGYWEPDDEFNLSYTSLVDLIDHDLGDEEIWWIIKYGDSIIFQSFGSTFLYNGTSVIRLLSGRGILFPPVAVHDRLFVQALDTGLFEIKNQIASYIPGSELLVGKHIKMMAPSSDPATILIGTENDGFFTFAEGQFSHWQIAANEVFMQNQINRGLKISESLYAVGTILGGLFLMNEDGIIVSHIDKENGLNNNTVLSLYLDMEQNLWAGLDNGVDLIKINSPLYYNTAATSDIGSVYTSALHKDYLYLGTNSGVYYLNLDQSSGGTNQSFELIPGSQGQIWNLSVIDDVLICGHNAATFIVEEEKLRTLSSVAGGYDLKQYPYDREYLVQGGYAGLFVYRMQNGEWRYSHRIEGYNTLAKSIEFEREDVLWVAHPHRGLFRLELNDDLTEVVEQRTFFENEKSYVNKLNNKLVFSSDSGFLYYDEIQDSFTPLDKINSSLGSYALNAHIAHAHADTYWIFSDGNSAIATMDETEVSEFSSSWLSELHEHLIPGHEDIYVVDPDLTLIYLDNGYAIFDGSWDANASVNSTDILFRNIEFVTPFGESYLVKNDSYKIPYKFNSLILQLSYPEYASEEDLVYNLEGYSTTWTNSNFQDQVHIPNIPYGVYTMRVKPENSSEDAVYSFSFIIDPPWHQSTLAKVLYVLVAVLSIATIVFLNKRKIKKIHEKHELKRKQMLEKEAAENEKRSIEMRNENLRNELKLRNSRLARSTFSLIHKNNTLISVKEELTKIKEELGSRFPGKYFNRILRSIDKDLTSGNDWKMFEQSFSEVHENFLQKLKEEFSDLTPADIQLCAYLKMNLSSKEIASLLNITVRGVEIRRYRLRKKLHLEHDTNLVEFIMGY